MIRALAGRLRQRLPRPVLNGARKALLGWGFLTADLRPPPEIIVVGAQRAGTTTLFRLLSEHPRLRRPTINKGTGYFDDDYSRGTRWYRAHFPIRLRRGATLAFECSGYYLFHPLAAARIARDLPGCHVVVMVRDPVERAYSSYRHEFARGFETLSFADAVTQEAERTRGLGAAVAADSGVPSFGHRHHCYLQRSQYAEQIARFVAELGRDRVHVVDANRLFADPVTTYLDLQRSLGLPSHRPAEVGRWNERPGAPLPDDLRNHLQDHFEPHDAALALLLGDTPSWRKEPSR